MRRTFAASAPGPTAHPGSGRLRLRGVVRHRRVVNTASISVLLKFIPGAALVAACALTSLAPAGDAAVRVETTGRSVPPQLAKHGLNYTGLVRARRGPCLGAYIIRTKFGRDACTHGPDPSPANIDVRRRATYAQLVARARSSRTKLGRTSLSCPDSSEYRVQALYARPAGTPDNFAIDLPLFRAYAEGVQAVYSGSAGETGGSRTVRFVTDAACQLSVISLVVSSAAAGDFTTMISELQAQGYRDSNRK